MNNKEAKLKAMELEHNRLCVELMIKITFAANILPLTFEQIRENMLDIENEIEFINERTPE